MKRKIIANGCTDSMGNVVKQTLALAENPTPENAPITETTYGAEALEDGVYNVTTTTPIMPQLSRSPACRSSSFRSFRARLRVSLFLSANAA